MTDDFFRLLQMARAISETAQRARPRPVGITRERLAYLSLSAVAIFGSLLRNQRQSGVFLMRLVVAVLLDQWQLVCSIGTFRLAKKRMYLAVAGRPHCRPSVSLAHGSQIKEAPPSAYLHKGSKKIRRSWECTCDAFPNGDGVAWVCFVCHDAASSIWKFTRHTHDVPTSECCYL